MVTAAELIKENRSKQGDWNTLRESAEKATGSAQAQQKSITPAQSKAIHREVTRQRLQRLSSFPTGAVLPLDIAPSGVSFLTAAEKRKLNSRDSGKSFTEGSNWNQLANEYYRKNWVGKLYDKIDYGAYGWFPGGIPRDRVGGADAETKADLRRDRAAAEADAAAARQELDYSKKNWYEYLGFSYSQQEKDFQRMQNFYTGELLRQGVQQRGADRGINISMPTIPSIPSLSPDTAKASLLNYALLAIAGIAVLVGVNK